MCMECYIDEKIPLWNLRAVYLCTADYSMKKSCGIYELKSENGRPSYKIFADSEDLQLYLNKNTEIYVRAITLKV